MNPRPKTVHNRFLRVYRLIVVGFFQFRRKLQKPQSRKCPQIIREKNLSEPELLTPLRNVSS